VYDFCVYETSAFYLDVVKDILYVESPTSLPRRSAQTVIYHILDVLVRILAPILPFTSEEVWSHAPLKDKEESVHLSLWPDLKAVAMWKNAKLDSEWARILTLRDHIMKLLEIKREQGLIGSSLEAAIFLYADSAEVAGFLKEKSGLFPQIFKVSEVLVAESEIEGMDVVPQSGFKVKIAKAGGKKCMRCWNYAEDVNREDLCGRCKEIIAERSGNG
jgi:isoleucyl-tRNA synthetase